MTGQERFSAKNPDGDWSSQSVESQRAWDTIAAEVARKLKIVEENAK